jgi:hypothetical protein
MRNSYIAEQANMAALSTETHGNVLDPDIPGEKLRQKLSLHSRHDLRREYKRMRCLNGDDFIHDTIRRAD